VRRHLIGIRVAHVAIVEAGAYSRSRLRAYVPDSLPGVY
jgi:hypothetical protein